MFKNYFKTALRSISRYKTFSIINILGLAIGMAASILIFLWIENEYTFDRYYKNTDRLYQVYNRYTSNGYTSAWNDTQSPLAAALKKDYPEIEDAVRTINDERWFEVHDEKIKGQGLYVDTGFLSMFEFPLLSGNMRNALNDMHNIVITGSFSKKLFGNKKSLGKIVKIDDSTSFIVSAVLKDLPSNTRFDFEYLLPLSYNESNAQWGAYTAKTYALLKPNSSLENVNKKIKYTAIKYAPSLKFLQLTQFLHPASKWHLYSEQNNGNMVDGQIKKIRLFAAIAIFILLIACINFMNLSTARSEKRAKEVGIRKVAGARKASLIFQFITEGLLFSFVAGALAILIVVLVLPAYNKLTSVNLSLNLINWKFWLSLISFILFTGLLAGSYPAFFLSSFSPVNIFKKGTSTGKKSLSLRNVLVVFQFTIAIVFIISTIVIYKQLKYGEERNNGYDKSRLLYSSLDGDIGKNYVLIRNELLNSGSAISVTKTMNPITADSYFSNRFIWAGNRPEDTVKYRGITCADAGFAKTMGVKIIQGRDIDIYKYPTDSNAAVLNEVAVKAMHLQQPVGMNIRSIESGRIMHIVGVVKDFIVGSPYEPVAPLIIAGPSFWFTTINYRLNGATTVSDNLSAIEKIFRKYNPGYPFKYTFVDEEYAAKFKIEQATNMLYALFATLTIFISCMGLFGLSAYKAETRKKEIGIRKVLGASVDGIILMMSKDFIKLVVVSIVIASPIAWWMMYKWLQSYQYRINVSAWVFVLSGLIALIIALATISFQSIKAAMANPVKSLRTE
jgi:ABC-type antimicrobial peptide transport system permease subunit